MRFKKLGKSDLEVSVVSLGTWAMGNDYWGKVDDDNSIKTIQKAIDCGINLIDTAPAYGDGHAEEIVGKAIKGRRNEVLIATKCGLLRDGDLFIKNSKPESLRKEIDASLTRLGVDCIDLYQIHWPDQKTAIEQTMNELIKIHDAGKFRYLGVSNFDKDLLEKSLDLFDIVSVQPKYSLLERESEELFPFYKENRLGVLTYGSMAGGILTGKYDRCSPPNFGEKDRRVGFYPFFSEPLWSKAMDLIDELKEIAEEIDKPLSHLAINWVNQNDCVSTALVGAKTPQQIEQTASAGDWALTTEQIKRIEDAYMNIFSK